MIKERVEVMSDLIAEVITCNGNEEIQLRCLKEAREVRNKSEARYREALIALNSAIEEVCDRAEANVFNNIDKHDLISAASEFVIAAGRFQNDDLGLFYIKDTIEESMKEEGVEWI